jgi:hypothetical protein
MQSFFDVIALMLKRAPWVQWIAEHGKVDLHVIERNSFKEVEAGLNPEGERIVP